MSAQHTKQVRFAYKTVLHSPTPKLALSLPTSVTPSSSGDTKPSSSTLVLAPPSSRREEHHPPTRPKPIQQTKHPTIHRYLRTSAINWDLRDRPSTITRNRHPLALQSLREPASNPPIRSIRIKSSYLPWAIRVSASNHAFVTVGEVVEAVYCAMRTTIGRSEFRMLTRPDDQCRAIDAYEERYRRVKSTRYDEEKRRGLRCIDLLMGHTHFIGITNDGHRSDEWNLAVC